METYVLRVWLPDRPGALGLVASRIGAVRGDVLNLEIIERGGGQAIDELLVALPSSDLVPLMLSEVGEVDGVSIEEVWAVGDRRPTRDARMLDLVEAIVCADPASMPQIAAAGLAAALDADWVVLLAGEPPQVIASTGEVPELVWLGAFLDGARATPATASVPTDLAWAAVGELTVAAGRARWELRAAEREHVRQLATIVAAVRARRVVPGAGSPAAHAVEGA